MKRIKSPEIPDVDEIRDAIDTKSRMTFSKNVEFLHSGCSMLNLMSSGRIVDGGYPRARIINLVGDGSSGKTILALEFMAATFWAFKANGNLNPSKKSLFKPTKRLFLVYNNVEGVMDFDIEKMFGTDFFESVEWISSDTIEKFGSDFFSRVMGLKAGDTIIYVIDSWDAIDSKEDKDKFEKKLKSDAIKIEKGTFDNPPTDAAEAKESGSYELGKQKYASKRFFKKVCADIQSVDADCTLVIISQVRTKIGVTFGEKQYRAGGDALNFYTHLVIWLREVEKLKTDAYGQTRVYGIDVHAKVKRSKVWKPFRECHFRIIFDFGIDDIYSLMVFYFGPKKSKLNWLGDDYSRDKLYNLFKEDPEQLDMLKQAVQAIWDDVEEKVAPKYQKYEQYY